MRDQLSVDLEDSDLLSEVELSVSLMIAGTESVEHLSRDEIDELLGVTPVASGNKLVPRQPEASDRLPERLPRGAPANSYVRPAAT